MGGKKIFTLIVSVIGMIKKDRKAWLGVTMVNKRIGKLGWMVAQKCRGQAHRYEGFK